MKNWLPKTITIVAILMMVALPACSKDDSYYGSKPVEEKPAAIQKLILTGSSTVAPLAAEIGKAFEVLHPNVRIDVQAGGSSRGVNDARSGMADIGMASRDLKTSEQDLLHFTIARDGVCLILNSKNLVKELSNKQVVAIYTGEISNWKDVGGADAPITVVNKAEGHSTLELFLKYFGLKNEAVKADVIIGDNEQGIKTVAGNPNAIGYVSIGTAEYDSSHGVAIKLLSVNGIAASIQSVQSGKFPISRPLNLVTKAEPVGLAKQFIEFASSAKVNHIINEQYFVPIKG